MMNCTGQPPVIKPSPEGAARDGRFVNHAVGSAPQSPPATKSEAPTAHSAAGAAHARSARSRRAGTPVPKGGEEKKARHGEEHGAGADVAAGRGGGANPCLKEALKQHKRGRGVVLIRPGEKRPIR